MKRNPRKLAWTKSFRKAHAKEMTVDTTLTFAARRNVPVRYNRELVATTLVAMKRVEEIRQRRERVFYRKRMEGNTARSLEEDRKLVEENQHLLPPGERYVQENKMEMEEDMEQDEEMQIADRIAEENEMDFEEEDEDGESGEESDEEEILQPVKIKSRLPRAKMTVKGGIELD
jgi:large subunit ribosomal protein L24e